MATIHFSNRYKTSPILLHIIQSLFLWKKMKTWTGMSELDSLLCLYIRADVQIFIVLLYPCLLFIWVYTSAR